MEKASVGFRVKSGRATAVLLAAAGAALKVIDRRVVQLSDPAVPDSTQPYHAALGRPPKEAEKTVARLLKVVERLADRSVAELLERYRNDGYRIVGVGLVVGSDVDPATIANDHIRAHAAEGRLFRVAIEKALRSRRFSPAVTVEKELLAKASKALGEPAARLKQDVTLLGRELGGPWRAEEKAATLAAWMVLGQSDDP